MLTVRIGRAAALAAGLLCLVSAVGFKDDAEVLTLQADGRFAVNSGYDEVIAGGLADSPAANASGQQEPETVKELVARIKALGDDARSAAVAPVVIAVGLAAIFVFFQLDPSRRSVPQPSAGQEATGPGVEAQCLGDNNLMAISVIVALTSYRFYTGFLGATWVPFLVAKEGSVLVQDRQSLFMGVEKLIYGFSIFLNPIFGLLSDRLATAHPWCGRSSFLLTGIALAAVGIYGAKLASDGQSGSWYLAASGLWMLGEALADTATEAVVPELVPKPQYDLAASIRSLHFIGGGMTGYLALIAFQDLHHHWLYIAYLSLMLMCALLTVVILHNKAPITSALARRQRSSTGSPLLALLVEAYIAPMRYPGGFPRACLCMFSFSVGTAPIFFTLLMVRDLVGISSAQEQQMHFSCISIVFLVCAALSAVAAGTGGGSQARSQAPADPAASQDAPARRDGLGDEAGDVSGSDQAADEQQPAEGQNLEASSGRWAFMIASMAAFALMCALLPTVGLPGSEKGRLATLYIISGFLGLSFGGVYARFQSCTWTLLPPGVDVANAMGFAAVMKVAGCGLGNFIAGLILDTFRAGGQSDHVKTVGYIFMDWFCAAAVFASVALISGIRRQKRVVRFGKSFFCLC